MAAITFIIRKSVQTELCDKCVDCSVGKPAADETVNLRGKGRILLCCNTVLLGREGIGNIVAVVALVCSENGLINTEGVNCTCCHSVLNSGIIAELLEACALGDKGRNIEIGGGFGKNIVSEKALFRHSLNHCIG